MKKLIVCLMVLMLAGVASAQNSVTISLTDEDNGVLAINYVVDPCSTSVPVAYSLTLVTTDGVTVEPCDVLTTDPCYPVFIDFAHDAVGPNFDPATWDPCDPCYTIGDGHPMADPDAAGAPVDPCDTFSICMGRLDENQTPGPMSGTLCTIQLADGGAGYTDVTVAADSLRGGVVGSTFTVVASYEDGAATRVDFAEPPCYQGPDQAEWLAVGSPQCWCNANQCYGDADGLSEQFGFGFVAVGDDDLAIMAANWKQNPSGEPGICADFNHDDEQFGFGFVRIGDDDLAILSANWKQNPAGDCNQ